MSEAAAPQVSAGALLRQAREAAGLHVAALAVSLKVPVRKLEALEEDRHADLPDAVFARALASSVCRHLKVDPQPVLARLPQTAAPRLVQANEGINAPFRAPGDVVTASWQQQLARPVPLIVGALLLGAIVILLLPRLRIEDSLAAARSEAPAVPMAAPVVVESGATAAAGGQPGAGAAHPQPVGPAPDVGAIPQVTAAAVTPQAAVAVAQPALAAAATPAAPAEAPAAPAAPAIGLVVFKASGPSWVQVLDSRGEVALRRLLAAGESAGATGSLPLSVTVGSVDSTAVEVRGKPFDLSRVATKDNVARFEVK
ncbi:helix-turn-helix domain-containing protein [Ramlibacter tataouinensis]|uniref:helix-turn-helix domain-containing protein n=1 Tax=Ramlibacter tataouinensis TaxID=94132 RepID=UPI0022F3EFC5|nr:helix-turn-helix domain-containing protein [Ramlibacter tataouinensis]WBY01868.1 helix-turn-helix domain-containing protein [Ramlibacter tataouinensis]